VVVPSQETPASPQFDLVMLGNTFEAFGMVMDFLSRREPFMYYDVGHLSAAVRLQLRHEYHFAALTGRTLVGYAGWLPTSSEAAALWIDDRGPLSPIIDHAVDAFAVTIVATADPAVTRPILRAVRKRNVGKRAFFKREAAQDPAKARKASVYNA
jgi:hypothetical protein